MPEPKKSAARSSTRSRSKKKASPATLLPEPAAAPDAAPAEPSAAPGSLESFLLMGLGVLLVIGALFPRSLRQLLMLGLGTGLLYRGSPRRRE